MALDHEAIYSAYTGIVVTIDDSAGAFDKDGNSVTQFQVDVPNGDVFAYNLAEDGILFEGGMTISTLTKATATIILDK